MKKTREEGTQTLRGTAPPDEGIADAKAPRQEQTALHQQGHGGRGAEVKRQAHSSHGSGCDPTNKTQEKGSGRNTGVNRGSEHQM